MAHTKLWNNQGNDKYVKELKPNTYKSQSKQTLIGSYFTMLTPEEREIAMKPMKRQQEDDEDIPNGAELSEDKIQPDLNGWPEKKSTLHHQWKRRSTTE